MKLKVISTGSSGNCYSLTDKKGNILLLECGVTFAELKKGIDHKIDRVVGCLITHEHGDHAKCAKDLIKAGVDVYASKGTQDALCIECITVDDVRCFSFFSFRAMFFSVIHDAKQPICITVYHKEIGYLAFVTDTSKIGLSFSGINHILLEANYSRELLEKEVIDDRLHFALGKRVIENHLSIENAIEMLKNSNLSSLKTLMYVHLSSTNAYGEMFQKMTMREIGVKPLIAEKELEVEL